MSEAVAHDGFTKLVDGAVDRESWRKPKQRVIMRSTG